MTSKKQKTKSQKNNQHHLESSRIQKKLITDRLREIKIQGLVDGIFVYSVLPTVNQIASALHKPLSSIVQHFFKNSVEVQPNAVLTDEQVGEICLEFGFDFKKEINSTAANFLTTLNVHEKKENLQPRNPIVTIMGHVDHGKTTLLERYYKRNLLSAEHGGITQHIGAYSVELSNNRFITFIDTPGHAAFTEMRARGSAVTDIVVLVVAADDGMKPQTREAIHHAKAAGVPIVVFINKMDRPGADAEKVVMELSQEGLIDERLGGDTIMIEGSALKGDGLEDLLEAIFLVSDIKELKANPNQFASGIILESELNKTQGPLASLIITNGTLYTKDLIVAGASFGRIRAIRDDKFERINSAGPGRTVQIQGLGSVPIAGDQFLVISDVKLAKEIVNKRKDHLIEQNRTQRQKISLEDLFSKIQSSEEEIIDFNLIIKSDTTGTMQALAQDVTKIEIPKFNINIIHKATGGITESDVVLASASNAILIGFNVGANVLARKKAEQEGVEIRLYNIIYKAVEDITAAAKGLLAPSYIQKIVAHLEVRKLFFHSVVGTIAGCRVMDGEITRSSQVNLIRNGAVIYKGELSSLKHEKNDMKKAKTGQECGVVIKNYNDIKVDDVIEAYEMVLSS